MKHKKDCSYCNNISKTNILIVQYISLQDHWKWKKKKKKKNIPKAAIVNILVYVVGDDIMSCLLYNTSNPS